MSPAWFRISYYFFPLWDTRSQNIAWLLTDCLLTCRMQFSKVYSFSENFGIQTNLLKGTTSVYLVQRKSVLGNLRLTILDFIYFF